MATTRPTHTALRPGCSRRLVLAAALGSVAFLGGLPAARAGFEWTPPPAAPSHSAAPAPLAPSDLAPPPRPLAPVASQPLSAPAPRVPAPLSPLPPMAAKNTVPTIDLHPLKNDGGRKSRLAALQSVQTSPAPKAPALPPQPGTDAPLDFVPPARLVPAAGTSARPPASASSSLTIESLPEVAGFGRDVPLALAMRQVVPASYGFSFAEGVNPGQRVSWTGGKPWNQVLDSALRPHGLSLALSGNAVRVEPSSTPLTPAPVISPRPFAQSPAPAARMRPAVVSAAHVPVKAPASPAAPTRVVMKGIDTEALPDPVASATSTGAPVSLTRQTSPGFPQGLVKAREPMDLPVVSDRTPASRAGIASAPSAPLPLTPSRAIPDPIVSAPQGDVRAIPVSIPIKAAPPASRSFDMNTEREWSAPAGTTLRRILTDWSQQAGVQLHWSSQFDYPIQANVRMTATYQKAVETVLDGLRDAKPRPLARLHPNLPAGPAVLILQTQHVIN